MYIPDRLPIAEATRAQGDEEVVDNENEATEHDVSTVASADPNSESGTLHTVEVSGFSAGRLFLGRKFKALIKVFS